MFKPFIRGWTLVSKEIMEIVRQPFLVLALVLGPFLILLVFALGHRSQQPPLRAILSIPANVNLSQDLAFWRDRFGGAVTVVALTPDETPARAAVENDQVDLAVIVPADAYDNLKANKQATIRVLSNQINPTDQSYTNFVAYLLSSEMNKQIITDVAHQAQDDIGKSQQPLARLRQDLGTIPDVPSDQLARMRSDVDRLTALSQNLQSIAPGLLAAPVTSKVESVAAIDPGYVAFYSPGVLALLLQHMAITFAALSVVRDRLVGMIEVYAAAPTSAFGMLLGKYISYGIMTMAVGGALTVLMTRYLAVPLLGTQDYYWGTLALLVFASLGVGLTISFLSASQENAVQLTMLVLLASVFFSGFFLPLSALQTPATQVSAVLPVSHAIVALQDVMLRGQLKDTQPLFVLGGMGMFFFILNAILVRRELQRT
jgi:ABC-2 type transport system permease protein